MISLRILVSQTSESLGGETNHAARKPRAGVASGLGGETLLARLAVVTLAKVIGKLVHNNRPAEDACCTSEGDLLVRNVDGATRIGGSHIAKITSVPLIVGRGAVRLASGVEVGTAAHASIGGITQLMDVEAMISRLEAGDGSGNDGTVGPLSESDGALDAGRTLQNKTAFAGILIEIA
eukprot:CAMPEP_0172008626 /NCGR_PEP_ID=MMETSP1041-20130122/6747_1 /TAXON_ID=464988 /ORGANISM="Hemiselmis andersenii, Strain CCMP439" /LENGTH=178 /DNA_ID=CAMNT_0012662833 /DNA_START=99 /DNA_END=632 /DNA_ORIENTATION=-